MVETALSQLVVIEDATILRMLRDQRFVDAFPFLQNAAVAITQVKNDPARCGKCGAKNRAVTANHYADIKRSIASLPSDRKVLLKQLLGAKQSRVIYRGHDGKTIRSTF